MNTRPEPLKTNADIRHDLKNTVAVIKGYAQLLTQKLHDQPDRVKYSQKIDLACNQLIEKINQLIPDDRV